MADSVKETKRKLRYNTRKAAGVCCTCGAAPAINATINCVNCTETNKLRTETRRNSRKVAGLCPRCGHNKTTDLAYCFACREHLNQHDKDTNLAAKLAVYSAYGNQCACCGETCHKLLTIDHKNNDGAAHRRELKQSSQRFYRWLVANDFPIEFQLLCYNCNCGRYRNGGPCPHEESRPYTTQGIAFDAPTTTSFLLVEESQPQAL